MLRESLLSWYQQVSASVGHLIVVRDEAQDGCVVSKLNDDIGAVLGSTVLNDQGVQEGAKHTALWYARVEDQQEGGVAANSHHLGPTCQEVEYLAAAGGLQSKINKLRDEF